MLITGASRGIGAATARLAGEQGYAVAVNSCRNANAANSVVADIEASGGVAIAVQGDVAREADVLRIFETVDEKLGTLSVLVNNAGILETQMRLDEMSAARIDRVFGVNVRGSFLCAREAVRRMSTRYGGKGGAIVNLTSKASRIGSPNEFIDYAASKGAIDTMTLGLAKEVAAEGIRVNAVAAGLITTDIHIAAGEPGRPERMKGAIPMQRAGTADEVAKAILWLAGDDASYTTGSIVEVTGGR
ncbi:MAG TPA: SDR family oxidoreductase [Rhizobiales bacterium]|nr:SDR family oxidoreductase [Hyphomicrobiales bacterium]